MQEPLRVGLFVCAAALAALALFLLVPGAPRVLPEHAQSSLAKNAGRTAVEAARTPPTARVDASDASAEQARLDTERSPELALMREAERVLLRTPQQTLVLIESADRRFGTAVEARRKLEIEALVRLSRIGLAQSKADRFYRAFPNSAFIAEIERRTGYHPRPTGPVP
jgi:hypothetical protein